MRAVIWTLLPSNIAGKTKKTVTASVLFIAFCVGNSIGTQIMRPQDAPKYVAGITACGVLYVVEFVLIGLWRFYCKLSRSAQSHVVIVMVTIADRDLLAKTFGRTRNAPASLPIWAFPQKRASALASSMPRQI